MPPYNPYPPLPSFGPPAALPTPEPEGEYEQLYRAIQAEEAAKEKARIAAMPPRPAALTEGLAQLNENRGYADDLAPAAPRRAALTFDTLDPNNPEAARLAQMEQAYQEYGKVPEYRRSGGALGDIGKNIYSGGAGLLGAGAFLGEKIGFDTREFQEAMAERQQRTVAEMTPEMRLALQKKWVPGEGEGSSALGDWRAYAGTIAQSIPAMAAGFGLGGAAAKALQTGAMALKGGAALTRGQALATGTTGYSLGEGVVGSGFAGAEIANEIGDMNPEQLSKSPVYNELTKTMSHEEAREVLRDKASSQAMWVAGGLTALLGAPSGLFFTRMLTNPGIEAGTRVGKNQAVDLLTAPGRTRTGSAAKGAGFEALQEAGQGAGEVLGANLAKQEYVDPSQSLTEGMLENMVGGAVAGGAFGGALGAAAHRPPKRPFEELSANELEGHRQKVRLQLAELQKEDVGGTAIETSDTEAYKTAQVERLQAIGAELAAETERRSAPLRKLKDGALAKSIDRANARVQTLEAKLGEQDAERPVVRGQVPRARLQQELANARNAAEQGMLEQERRAQQQGTLAGEGPVGTPSKSDEELLKEAQPEELQQLLTGVQQEVQDLRNFPERAETKIGQRRVEALTKMEEALQGEIMQREADNATDPELDALSVKLAAGTQNPQTKAMADAVEVERLRRNKDAAPASILAQPSDMAKGGPVGRTSPLEGGPVGGQGGPIQGGPQPQTQPAEGVSQNAQALLGDQEIVPEGRRQGEAVPIEGRKDLPGDEEGGRAGIEPRSSEGAAGEEIAEETLAGKDLDVLQKRISAAKGEPSGQQPTTPSGVTQIESQSGPESGEVPVPTGVGPQGVTATGERGQGAGEAGGGTVGELGGEAVTTGKKIKPDSELNSEAILASDLPFKDYSIAKGYGFPAKGINQTDLRKAFNSFRKEGKLVTEKEKEVKPVADTLDKKRAVNMRIAADRMEDQIDAKINSATSQQNMTPRRALIVGKMRKDGYAMQETQSILRNLANAHEQGTVPDALKGIYTRANVERLRRFSDIKKMMDSGAFFKGRSLYNLAWDDEQKHALKKAGIPDNNSLEAAVEEINKLVTKREETKEDKDTKTKQLKPGEVADKSVTQRANVSAVVVTIKKEATRETQAAPAPTEKLSPLDEWNAENIDRHPIAREKEVVEGVDEFVIPGLGYAEKGGKALSSATTGKVTGRTKWIPKNAWYTNRPKDAKGKYIMDEKYLENAWKKHKAGEKPLTPKQKEAVAYLVSVQQEYYRWRDDIDVALEEEGGFGKIDDEQATIAAMMDDANDIDEGATERAVIQFEDPQYNSKLINELQRIIESGKTEQQATTQGGSKGQKESTTERQQELLSEAPAKSEQELNAAKEEKEAKRNQGGKYVPQGEEDLLTGGKLSPREPDLFAEKKSKRRSDFLDIALTPLQEYFAAFDAFTAKRLEAAFIKKKGVDAIDWLIEKRNQKTVWSNDGQGRKISGTGLQELSIKDLWPTEDGLGEKLRKSMLKAIRAINKVGYSPHWMKNIQAGRDVFEDSTTEPRTSISKSTTKGAAGGQTTTSLRAELVDRWGERLIKALERTGILRIEQSPGDTTGGGKGLYSTTAGVWDGKRMTLYADNIPKGDGSGVLVHEGGEHAGMEEMLGPQYADVSAQFDRLLKDGDEYAVAADASTRAAEQAELQAATARGASGSNLSSIMERLDRKRDSEHLAYLVQIWTNDKRNASKGVTALVRRILQAIRAWWYKSPMARSLARRGIKMDLRVEDIVALSESSLRRLAAKQRKLPRAPMTRNAARPGPTIFNEQVEELGDLQGVGQYSLANATKGVYDTIGDKYKAVGNLSKEDVVEASKRGKSKARSTARKGLLWVTTLGQIGDMFGNVFEEASGQNSLKELISATDAMDAQKNRLLHFAENTRRKWADLPRKKTDDLGGILLDATSKRVHPDRTWAAQQDDWKNQPDEDLVQAKRDYAVLNRRWEALGRGPKGKETQSLYKEIVKQLDDQFKAAKQALLDRIDGTVTGAAEKARLKMVVEDTFKGLEIGPYFPLSRFGDHHALTWKEDANGEKFDYTRYAFRSEYEARQAVDRARKSGREAEYRVIGDYKGDDPAAAGGFAKDLIDKLNVEGLMEGKSGQELRDSIVQLSLQFAPDLSWSKHRIHRKRTPGWSTDAMRAYSQGTMSGAYHIARTANAWKMNKAVNRMSTVSGAGGRKTPQVAEEDVAAATMVTDRVQKLTDNNISPNVSPVAAAVNSLGFFWMLGISPAAAAVNLTQVPLVSLPYFASRVTNGSPIGLTRARRALGSAYKAFLTEGRKGIVDPDSLDLIKGNTQLSGDEQVVLKNLIENGKLNFTRARSLISNAEYGETSTPLQESFARIVEWSGGLFQRAEVINRYVTALAAVRLAPASASVNEKTDIATQALDTTQFDYSRANRAAIMRPNAMRVATQFMQFSQNMLYTLLRNSYNAVRKGATKDERSQARRMLAYLAGTHVMAGGLMALPFLSTAFAVANMLHDACPEGLCDDDEWDARVEFQNIIHDIVTPVAGEGGAEAARKGLINSALGIDISSRVSLNDLLWRRPDPAAEGRDAWTHWAQEVAGPVFGGMASSFFMAARDIEQGETWRGTERLLPKGLKDILKASRFAEEGALNYAKDPLVEDFSPFVLGAQAAGFAPAELNLQYERAQAIKNRKTGIQRTRSRLMRSYALAVKLGFTQEKREIYKKIVKWNARHPMNKISSKNLAQSIRSRLRASSRRTAGQVLTPAMERAVLPEVRF